MNENKFNLIFEGPLINDHGVPLEDLVNTVSHLQRAIRLLVREFEGIDATLGRPPQIVVEQSTLRLVGTSSGSVKTEWELTPPVGVQPHLNRSGVRAVQSIFDRGDAADGKITQLLPTVEAELNEIANDLSADVDIVKMTSASQNRSIEFRRSTEKKVDVPEPKENLETHLAGKLLEVNWDRCTAQLHRYSDKYIRLIFRPELGDEMQRLATKYVEVYGRGVVDESDQWKQIEVQRIGPTHSWAEPFDLEAVLYDSNLKVFHRDNVVTASEPFDVEGFNRIIREGRRDS